MEPSSYCGTTGVAGRRLAPSLRFALLALSTPMALFAREMVSTGTEACGHGGQADKLLNVATAGVVILSLAIASYQRTAGNRPIAEIIPFVVSGLLLGALAQMARVLISLSPFGCDLERALASALPWL